MFGHLAVWLQVCSLNYKVWPHRAALVILINGAKLHIPWTDEPKDTN